MADHKWTVGQTVAFCPNYTREPVRRTIERVTPSGRAVIATMQFHADGGLVGRGRFSSCRIAPWTDETAARVKERGRQIVAKLVAEFIRSGVRDHATPDEIIEAVRAALAPKAAESPGASNPKG